MNFFADFFRRTIALFAIAGTALGVGAAMYDLLPAWAFWTTTAAALLLMAIPPRYKYFLFMIQEKKGKDYLVVAKDRYKAPIQRVLDVVDDCRIRGFTRIKKAQYKAFKKRAEINKNEYFILD